MAMLYSTNLGKGLAERHCTRSNARHNKQLANIKHRHFLEIKRKSTFVLIRMYNKLLAESARVDTVKNFKLSLQQLLGEGVISDCEY